MPTKGPRLQHRKSRRGCKKCKERKVKCDETRPTCTACTKHGVECEYEDFKQVILGRRAHGKTRSPAPKQPGVRQSSASVANPPSTVNDASTRDPPRNLEDFDLDPETRHILELKLLHYFCYVIGPTFMSTASLHSRGIWTCEAVSIALRNPCLLNAIFSIAALHAISAPKDSAPVVFIQDKELADRVYTSFHGNQEQTKFNRGDRASEYDYGQAHRFYFNRAVQEQRRALDVLSERNADAICLTSVLLCQTVVHFQPKPPEDGKENDYCPPIQWMLMGTAIKTVVMSSMPFLKPNDLVSHIMSYTSLDLRDNNNTLHPSFIEPFKTLLEFSPPDDVDEQDPEAKQVYRRTLAYVGGVCAAVTRGELAGDIGRRIQAFAPIIPKEFVDYLEQRRPRALVIFAHLLVNAKWAEEYWWYRGLADRDVFGIKSILPQEWMWAMEWPVKRLRELTEAMK